MSNDTLTLAALNRIANALEDLAAEAIESRAVRRAYMHREYYDALAWVERTMRLDSPATPDYARRARALVGAIENAYPDFANVAFSEVPS